MEEVFNRADRRVFVSCFSSSIHRIQLILDLSREFGRRVAVVGRSMVSVTEIAHSLGLLEIPDDILLRPQDAMGLPPDKVTVLISGTQGEPMSALARMAARENKWLTLGNDDVVIMSSHPIPGNETNVTKVIDGLTRIGVEVVHSGLEDVHATGHAKAEELKIVHSILRPEWFIPVHGEYHHLVAHARIASAMKMPPERIMICEDGDQVRLTKKGLKPHARVPAGYLYVDGIVGDVGHGVLRDRRVLAEEGVVVVVVGVDVKSGTIITGPEVITRGWIYEAEAADLLEQCESVVAEAVKVSLDRGASDIESLQRQVRRAAGKFVSDRTKRKPMIVPVVMEA